jgi:hypothetical protein
VDWPGEQRVKHSQYLIPIAAAVYPNRAERLRALGFFAHDACDGGRLTHSASGTAVHRAIVGSPPRMQARSRFPIRSGLVSGLQPQIANRSEPSGFAAIEIAGCALPEKQSPLFPAYILKIARLVHFSILAST